MCHDQQFLDFCDAAVNSFQFNPTVVSGFRYFLSTRTSFDELENIDKIDFYVDQTTSLKINWNHHCLVILLVILPTLIIFMCI